MRAPKVDARVPIDPQLPAWPQRLGRIAVDGLAFAGWLTGKAPRRASLLKPEQLYFCPGLPFLPSVVNGKHYIHGPDYPKLAKLRERCPVHWDWGSMSWVVSSYEAAKACP